jgi:hypothetical protein
VLHRKVVLLQGLIDQRFEGWLPQTNSPPRPPPQVLAAPSDDIKSPGGKSRLARDNFRPGRVDKAPPHSGLRGNVRSRFRPASPASRPIRRGLRTAYHTSCTRRSRAHRAPGIPCALGDRRARDSGMTRAFSRREKADTCLFFRGGACHTTRSPLR